MIIKLIALIIVLIGINLIFDARILIDKWFGLGDQNDGTTGLKIMGFIFAIVGSIMLYFT